MEGLGYFANAYLGRSQGPEPFFSFTHPTVASQAQVVEFSVPKTLNLNRPLEGFLIRYAARVDITTANYTAVAAEAPQTIIQRIRVNGVYKGTTLTPIDISGATAFVMPRLFGLRGNSAYIQIGAGAMTRQADPSVPFQQVGANFGNIATYELDLWYFVPVYPLVAKGRRAMDQTPYLWQPADWGDTIQIRITLGDRTSFGTPAGGTVVNMTAPNSGAGQPLVEIYPCYQILGAPFRSGFRTAVLIQNEQSIVSGMTAIANNVRIMPLQKQITPYIVLKTGRRLTGTSAGVDVFSDLRDTLLNRTFPIVDNRQLRTVLTNASVKEFSGFNGQTILPEGYNLFNFIESQTARTAFRADVQTVVGGASAYDLMTDVAETNADNLVNVLQGQIVVDRDDPYWAGTR